MKVINEALLQTFREKTRCEYCLDDIRTGGDPHHLFSRGAGRIDAVWNLIALCRHCHSAFHNGSIAKDNLVQIVSIREKVSFYSLSEMVFFVRQLYKHETCESILHKANELPHRAKTLVIQTLTDAGIIS